MGEGAEFICRVERVGKEEDLIRLGSDLELRGARLYSREIDI
jgi:hypothetical protein